MNSYSLIIFNRLEVAYGNTIEKSTAMESTIINGAGYFLEGYSGYLLVLNRIEKSPVNGIIDYTELQSLIFQAVENMNLAKGTYEALKNRADTTPYNNEVISKLLNFNYNQFQNTRGLNGIVFKPVKDFLGVGDVKGIIENFIAKTHLILEGLIGIKGDIDANTFPNISSLWRLNQLFSETMLMGQYSAEIFFEMTGK